MERNGEKIRGVGGGGERRRLTVKVSNVLNKPPQA
jgi:hypothetical protein